MNVIKSLFGISVLALAVACGDSANKSKDGKKTGEVALHQLADSTDAKNISILQLRKTVHPIRLFFT